MSIALLAIKKGGEALRRVFSAVGFEVEYRTHPDGSGWLHVIDCPKENRDWVNFVISFMDETGYELWDDTENMSLRRSLERKWRTPYENIRRRVTQPAPVQVEEEEGPSAHGEIEL